MSSSNHNAGGRYFQPTMTSGNDHLLNIVVKQIPLAEIFIHTARYLLVDNDVRVKQRKEITMQL
jgi:hypothetical protein